MKPVNADAISADLVTLNTAQSIAQQLRERILSGELAPKTRVTQRDLAAQFGRSPMPARDAIKMLMAEGLVVQESSKTIIVAPVNVADFVEIMELRRMLEPRALELSIPRLSRQQLAETRAVMASSGTTDDPRKIADNHWRFHMSLYREAGRPRLLALIEQQHNLLIRYLLPEWAMLGVRPNWSEDESELVNLVEQGDVATAAAWLRNDLDLATKRVINATN